MTQGVGTPNRPSGNQTPDAMETGASEATARESRSPTLAWQALIDTAPIAVWFAQGPHFDLVRTNRNASRLLGLPLSYPLRTAAGQQGAHPFRAVQDDIEPEPSRFPLQRCILGEEIRDEEWEIRFEDGRALTLLFNAAPVRDASGSIIAAVATAVEITERKRSEAALREREAKLQSILDTAPEALITIGREGLIESFSRSAEALFGYSADEVVGRNVSVLMPSPYREEHDGYLERYRRTGERRIIGIGRVVSARRKDGTVFPMELAVGEARLGSDLLFTGFIRDLTASQKIEQELRQAQKMEAVGQLTGGIAHDFNNLLTVILGNLEMLEMRLKDERLLELVRDARETAESGAQLTERLLAFGRRQPLQPRLTDVGQLIGGMTPLLRRTLGETILVRERLDSDVHKVLVDPSQLQNAILNLAINARDAMSGGGQLTITVENAELDVGYARLHPEVRAGRYVLVSVTDTGGGMSREVQERAFEPFFTTKAVGAGSGLGLSMVYGFAKQSGGHATIFSELGNGTTVGLFLPRSGPETEESEAGPAASPLDVVRGRGETVLLVEDEPRVRRMAFSRLQDLGYRALEAADGPAALALLDAHPDVAVLFTDMVMPGGMSGADLADAVSTRRPGIRVLFTSGYAEPDMVRRGQATEGRWLKKPYTALQLATALRAVLEEPPSER